MKSLIDKFSSEPADASMRELVEHVRAGEATDDDIAYLATTLGKSGTVLSIRSTQPPIDLASTGAPTSLSTLLGPLYLRSLGCCVPKLGVPGRPAGGIDSLAQVPGYRINLTGAEVVACIEQCGYAHFLANEEHAPLDASLFKFRRHSGTQNIPELAIASLLSKKLAVGLHRAGLEIRVAPHGNFGGTWGEARDNGRRFQRVARLLGIDAVCFLTDAHFPYQPFVGRGESLVALLELFDGTQDRRLEQHATVCFAMATATADRATGDLHAAMGAARSHFYENLVAQGSSPDAFLEYVDKVRTGHKFHFRARDHGFISIRLDRLRDLIVYFQSAGAANDAAFPDGMGIILRKMPGDMVRPNDIIATVRVPEDRWHSVQVRLEEVIAVVGTLETAAGFEKVTNG